MLIMPQENTEKIGMVPWCFETLPKKHLIVQQESYNGRSAVIGYDQSHVTLGDHTKVTYAHLFIHYRVVNSREAGLSSEVCGNPLPGGYRGGLYHQKKRTSREVKMRFSGYDITIPKGTAISNMTALGYDERYNFVADYEMWAPKLPDGSIAEILKRDIEFRGILISEHDVERD